MKVSIIGLDSSHTVEFTRRLMAPDCPESEKVAGATVVKVMRFETPFQDKAGLDARQKQLEEWGVRVSTDLAETVGGCDAIILCINDPSLHVEYFKRIAGLGKPIFIDKPLADTTANAKAILDHAAENKTRFWSSSSLRFVPQLVDACSRVPTPTLVSAFGALGKAAAGSSIVWYGVHAVEMMQRALGRGAKTVRAIADETGAVIVVRYEDARRGVVELCSGSWHYGGSLRGKEAVSFTADTSRLYTDQLAEIVKFFAGSPPPVAPEDALEVTAILDAAQRSVDSGKTESIGI
ncbi:MAG: Gfo/Idh/MocA family protein [Armatimonadota bacterium]